MTKRYLGLAHEACQISFSADGSNQIEIIIECDSRIVSDRIYARSLAVSEYATHFQAKLVSLLVDGAIVKKFPTHLTLSLNGRSRDLSGNHQGVQKLLTLPTRGDLKDLATVNPNLKIVKFDIRPGSKPLPGKGVVAGVRVAESSGLDQNQWQGRDMDEAVTIAGKTIRTWYPDDWQRFCGDLLKYGQLSDYSWKAQLYSGERCEFSGDLQLILLPPLIDTNSGIVLEEGGLGRMVDVKQTVLV